MYISNKNINLNGDGEKWEQQWKIFILIVLG